VVTDIVKVLPDMRFILQKPIWTHKRYSSLIVAMALLCPLQGFCADQPSPETELVQPSGLLASIDTSRDYVSGKIISFATEIDRFFANDRDFQESNNSMLQLALTKVSGYGGDSKIGLSARANLNLPYAEKRLHLLIESNPDQSSIIEPSPQTKNKAINTQVTVPQSYGLALRYEKLKEELKPFHLSADAGLKFQGVNVNPFIRSRGSYSLPLDKWRLKAAESVYWFNTLGVGETTQLDLEHVLSKSTLFRASSNLTWLNDKQNFDIRQDLSIYQTMNERNAILYQISAIGVSNPQLEVTEYIGSVFYRYKLHKDWVFFELSPQLHFLKTNNFDASFSLGMRLEFLFDGKK
jgi:hypothetical protein